MTAPAPTPERVRRSPRPSSAFALPGKQHHALVAPFHGAGRRLGPRVRCTSICVGELTPEGFTLAPMAVDPALALQSLRLRLQEADLGCRGRGSAGVKLRRGGRSVRPGIPASGLDLPSGSWNGLVHHTRGRRRVPAADAKGRGDRGQDALDGDRAPPRRGERSPRQRWRLTRQTSSRSPNLPADPPQRHPARSASACSARAAPRREAARRGGRPPRRPIGQGPAALVAAAARSATPQPVTVLDRRLSVAGALTASDKRPPKNATVLIPGARPADAAARCSTRSTRRRAGRHAARRRTAPRSAGPAPAKPALEIVLIGGEAVEARQSWHRAPSAP